MHFLWATHTIGGCIWAITLLRRVQRGHYLWRYFKFVWMESCEAKNSQKLKKGSLLSLLCPFSLLLLAWPSYIGEDDAVDDDISDDLDDHKIYIDEYKVALESGG